MKYGKRGEKPRSPCENLTNTYCLIILNTKKYIDTRKNIEKIEMGRIT